MKSPPRRAAQCSGRLARAVGLVHGVGPLHQHVVDLSRPVGIVVVVAALLKVVVDVERQIPEIVALPDPVLPPSDQVIDPVPSQSGIDRHLQRNPSPRIPFLDRLRVLAHQHLQHLVQVDRIGMRRRHVHREHPVVVALFESFRTFFHQVLNDGKGRSALEGPVQRQIAVSIGQKQAVRIRFGKVLDPRQSRLAPSRREHDDLSGPKQVDRELPLVVGVSN
jgi:hypothetical protein